MSVSRAVSQLFRPAGVGQVAATYDEQPTDTYRFELDNDDADVPIGTDYGEPSEYYPPSSFVDRDDGYPYELYEEPDEDTGSSYPPLDASEMKQWPSVPMDGDAQAYVDATSPPLRRSARASSRGRVQYHATDGSLRSYVMGPPATVSAPSPKKSTGKATQTSQEMSRYKRLQKNKTQRERWRKMVASETPHERSERKRKSAAATQKRRSNETEEQRVKRLAADNARAKRSQERRRTANANET